MEHWIEIPLNKNNNEVELLITDNISLHHGSFLICDGGTVTLTAKSLHFKPPGSKIKWSLDLKSIEELRREPSGYLSSGKIHFQVNPRGEGVKRRVAVWQCQVCEEINETEGGVNVKCNTCGSIQKGKLLEVNLDDTEPPTDETSVFPWKCEVCEEINESALKRCHSCGFSRPTLKIQWKCSTCTFVNGDSSQKCEVCEHPRNRIEPVKPVGGIEVAKPRYKLSFKSGGSTVFFNKLQKTWQESLNRNQPPIEESLTVGISGLLRRQEERNLAAEASLSTAFSDLDALMRSAGEMVTLAAKISDKINSAELSVGERNTFNDLVESLGILGDVEVNNLSNDSDSFYDPIARSVSILVQTMIDKTGTRVYSLADIFCIYNRTRTTGSLIAPADLLKAARRLTRLSLPVRLHKFTQKGMLCLVPVQEVDPNHLYTLIQQILTDKSNKSEKKEKFLTAVDLAHRSRISLLLAGQQLQMAEMAGKLVRDAKRKDLPAFYENILL